MADPHPPALLLHGPRRMGKSSILCQLPRLLGPAFAPCTLDCQNPGDRSSPEAFFSAWSRALAEGLKRRNTQRRKDANIADGERAGDKAPASGLAATERSV